MEQFGSGWRESQRAADDDEVVIDQVLRQRKAHAIDTYTHRDTQGRSEKTTKYREDNRSQPET